MITALLTAAGGGYLLGFAGSGSKLNTSSRHRVENAQILGEPGENCPPTPNAQGLFTDVRGLTKNSAQPFGSVRPGSSAKHPRTDYPLSIRSQALVLPGEIPPGSLRRRGMRLVKNVPFLRGVACLFSLGLGLFLAMNRKRKIIHNTKKAAQL